MNTKKLFFIGLLFLLHKNSYCSSDNSLSARVQNMTTSKNIGTVDKIEMIKTIIIGAARAAANNLKHSATNELDAIFEASLTNDVIKEALEKIVAGEKQDAINSDAYKMIQDTYGPTILQEKLTKFSADNKNASLGDFEKTLSFSEKAILEKGKQLNLTFFQEDPMSSMISSLQILSQTALSDSTTEVILENQIEEETKAIATYEQELAREKKSSRISKIKAQIERNINRITSVISNATSSLKISLKGWFLKQTLKYQVTNPIIDAINKKIEMNEALKDPLKPDNRKIIQEQLRDAAERIATLSNKLLDDIFSGKDNQETDAQDTRKIEIQTIRNEIKDVFKQLYDVTTAGKLKGALNGALDTIAENFVTPTQKIISDVFNFNPATEQTLANDSEKSNLIKQRQKEASIQKVWSNFLTNDTESYRPVRERAGTTAAGLGKPVQIDEENEEKNGPDHNKNTENDDTFSDENNPTEPTNEEPIIITKNSPATLTGDTTYQNLTLEELQEMTAAQLKTVDERLLPPDLKDEYEKDVKEEEAKAAADLLEKQRKDATDNAPGQDRPITAQEPRRPFGGDRPKGLLDIHKPSSKFIK